MDIKTGVIIVSYNSENVLPRCLDALQRQSCPPKRVFIVDNGSSNRTYLDRYRAVDNVTVIEEENIGFARANNRGFCELRRDCDFVLFLNPDAFPNQDFLEQAQCFMIENPNVGMISGKILWYNMEQDRPTNLFDSTGIFRKWYGRWYDRGQGEQDLGQFDIAENVPALCGAVIFSRCSALMDSGSNYAFDPDFFLYKEDIELSLRIRKRDWTIKYVPHIVAYHARGWKKERSTVPLPLRRIAAESELLLYKKHPSPYMLWAILKYLLVRFIRI